MSTSAGHPGPRSETTVRRPVARDGYDVAIVGAASSALRSRGAAACRGLSVLLLERGVARRRDLGAFAAGMLAPVAESFNAGERALLELGLQSARGWADFAVQLAEVSGLLDVGYRPCAALMLARDRDEAEALERERDLRERFGLNVEALLPSAARRLEPALAPTMRSALHLPDDHSADPRLVVRRARARRRARRRGAAHRRRGLGPRRPAGRAGRRGRRAVVRSLRRRGARTPGQGPVAAPARHRRTRPAARVELGRAQPRLPRAARRRALRLRARRGGARLDTRSRPRARLLRDAAELVPGVLELEVEEAIAGLRPGTPDNAPTIGRGPRDPRSCGRPATTATGSC